MIPVIWLILGGMLGAVIGALWVGIAQIAADNDEKEERRIQTREHGGIR